MWMRRCHCVRPQALDSVDALASQLHRNVLKEHQAHWDIGDFLCVRWGIGWCVGVCSAAVAGTQQHIHKQILVEGEASGMSGD